VDIQEEHLKNLDIRMTNDHNFFLQQLKFNPAFFVSACQDVTFQPHAISDKCLATFQQLQLKSISPNFLQMINHDQTCFLYLQQVAHRGNMDL
jgi:hypothetical protein